MPIDMKYIKSDEGTILDTYAISLDSEENVCMMYGEDV